MYCYTSQPCGVDAAAGPDPDSEQLTVVIYRQILVSRARARACVRVWTTRVYKHVRAGHCQLRAVPASGRFFPSASARAFQNRVDARNSATLDEPTAYFVTIASGLGTSRVVVARAKLLEIATR